MKKHQLTSMHSGRMHTARLLPVSPSMHCAGGCLLQAGICSQGVSAPGGGVCSWGVCSWELCSWGRGLSTPGGCLLPGGRGMSAWGVSVSRGRGCLLLGCLLMGRCISQHALRQTPLLPVDRIVDTRF